MRAGLLRHRVDIETASLQVADDYGQQTQAWSSLADDVPAEVATLGGVEGWKAKQIQPAATVQVRIRYNVDVTSECRFLYGTRYLYPVSIIPDVKDCEMVCLCKEQQ